MKSKIGAQDFKMVQNEYDSAFAQGSPFRNPEWFVRSIRRLLVSEKKSPSILDVACGDGHFLSFFEGYDRYGVDISKVAISKAKSVGKCVVSPAEKLPFPKDKFDFVTCMGSLEHFIDMDAALGEMKRVLRTGGTAVIHVPNSRYLVNAVLGVDTHHQINERFATESEWKSLISKYFTVKKTVKYNTRWFLKWIPKRYSCHFTFVCVK